MTLRLEQPEPPPPSTSPSAGGTRLLPENPKATSTLGAAAAEMVTDQLKPRRTVRWVGLGALAAAGIAFLALRPDRMFQGGTDKPAPVTVDPPRPTAPPPHATIDVPAAATTPAAPAKVTLQIESQPPGATVWVGDATEPRGRTPLRLVVPTSSGQVRATLKADGYADRTVTLDADRDQTVEVALATAEHGHHATAHAAGPGSHGHHSAPAASAHAALPPAETPTPAPPKTEPQKKYFLLGD